MLTVEQFIKELQKCDPKMKVMIPIVDEDAIHGYCDIQSDDLYITPYKLDKHTLIIHQLTINPNDRALGLFIMPMLHGDLR